MTFIKSISECSSRIYACGGPYKFVQTASGALYNFTIGPGNDGTASVRFYYHKSTDYGRTWSTVQVDSATTHTQMSVWYDRWSGISGDLIHMTFCDITSDDVFYRSLDTSTDTLGTERLVFNGATALSTSGSTISITVARGGNIYVYYDIDGGAETGFYRSTDAGATWASRSSPAEVTPDQVILMPGYAADAQDIMAFFWDSSADEISRKVYDNSANSWSETSISTSMLDPAAYGSYMPPWTAITDLANNKNIVFSWNGFDLANADLKAWSVDETSITALTDVVTNVTDDCYLASASIYGAKLVVYFAGYTDGTGVLGGRVPIMVSTSSDGGTTWTTPVKFVDDMDYRALFSPMIQYTAGGFCSGIVNAGTTSISVSNAPTLSPLTNGIIGVS